MSDVIVLRNQLHEFLNKSSEWIAEGDSKTLYRTVHKDESINLKVELTVKHPDLRIQCVAAEQASNGRILINSEDVIVKASASKSTGNEPLDELGQNDLLASLDSNEATHAHEPSTPEVEPSILTPTNTEIPDIDAENKQNTLALAGAENE